MSVLSIHSSSNGDRYELRNQGSYEAIVKTHDKGTPISEKYATAQIPLVIGQPIYIRKAWQDLLRQK